MIGLLRLNMLQVFSCVILLLVLQTACAKKGDDLSHEQNNNFHRSNSSEKNDSNLTEAQSINRRQDGGFDFMKYFIGHGEHEQEEEPAQQQRHQVQQPLSIQQQHQVQQQILKEQQRRQEEQLLQLQQQQLVQLQQQQPAVAYQQQTAGAYQQQPAVAYQSLSQSRDGGYGGGISIGNGYGATQPRDVAISIGGGKPVLQIGNILRILPRIFKVLSAGGKVMFGVELGNNFYFGPVGAKPLAKAG